MFGGSGLQKKKKKRWVVSLSLSYKGSKSVPQVSSRLIETFTPKATREKKKNKTDNDAVATFLFGKPQFVFLFPFLSLPFSSLVSLSPCPFLLALLSPLPPFPLPLSLSLSTSVHMSAVALILDSCQGTHQGATQRGTEQEKKEEEQQRQQKSTAVGSCPRTQARKNEVMWEVAEGVLKG